MNERPDLSMIIVNWNTAEALAECLTAVIADCRMPNAESKIGNRKSAIEIIVVDNASTDGSAERVRRGFPQVTLIANSQNMGFAAASNQGLRLARGRYLLLLNPDTVPRPGALAALVAFMDAHPEAGIAGPRLLYADGSLQSSGRPCPTLASELRDILALYRLTGGERFWGHGRDNSRVQEADSISGACLLIRRETMEEIGLLDEGYFLYFEETDWCLRAWQHGWKVYYVPQAEVVHHSMLSTKQRVEPRLVEIYFHSRMHYFRKHHSPWSLWVLRGALLVTSLIKLGVLSLAWLWRRDPYVLSGLAAHRRIVALCLGCGSLRPMPSGVRNNA
jgi:N-acetylglucosaminyl-diphospho-decaprenol L-rhamnosyltransferase